MEMYRNPFYGGKFGNKKCFCGSDKKLKKCHGREYSVTRDEYQASMKKFDTWELSPEGKEYYKEVKQ